MSDPADERRYRLLFEANPLPLWVYDLETLRFLDVNEVACQKYGYTREEFLALTIRDIRPPEDVAAVEESVRVTPAQQFSSGVWRHRLKNGTLIHVEITSHEMLYMGRRTRFVCPIDVTLRVRAEAALREREAGLRRAQAMARLAHVITGPDGAFESWSETFAELAGLPAAQMPGNLRAWLQRVVHPDDRALLRARSLEAAALGERVDVEYRLCQPDGALVHVRQVIEPIGGNDEDGRTRWFSTLQDVTSQKLAEVGMLQLNEALEQRVHERTAQLELSNHELALATAAAERANRAKTEFLSNMSHELRTPLNAIIGFGQLLAAPQGPVNAPAQAAVFADHIVKAGRHLLTLINDILDLAQIEAGKLPVAIARVALAEVFAECEAMIEPLAAPRGIRLRFPRDSTLSALADRTRLKQVLLNLLSNAVKYNRENGAVVVAQGLRDAGRVRITVQDTGAGLRAEQVQSLFQPFNRLGQEGGAAEGTGIGLVVTRHMVELMGGEIGVNSTPGAGSVFWIDLPADADPAAADPAVPAADDGTAHTVLCVEDDPSSLRLVQLALAARPDVRLLSARNGRRGVELAQRHLPALILMDNNMPEMSGRQAQAILRGDPRTAGIPIIALSAEAAPGAAGNGYFGHLAKPFDLAQLLVMVDQALKGGAGPHPA